MSEKIIEKKVAGRRMFIALEIVCIILIACLVGATSLYQLQINDKDNTISSLNSQVSQLNSNATNLQNQMDSLNSNVTNLQNQNKQLLTTLVLNGILLNQTQSWLLRNITYYDSQITDLQNQLKQFQAPRLGFFNLTAEDNRTIPNTPFLHLSGTIYNFGIEATTLGVPLAINYDVPFYLLYVKAYHNDGSVALETEYPHDPARYNIIGHSSFDLDCNFYYNGSALSSWTISLEQDWFI